MILKFWVTEEWTKKCWFWVWYILTNFLPTLKNQCMLKWDHTKFLLNHSWANGFIQFQNVKNINISHSFLIIIVIRQLINLLIYLIFSIILWTINYWTFNLIFGLLYIGWPNKATTFKPENFNEIIKWTILTIRGVNFILSILFESLFHYKFMTKR